MKQHIDLRCFCIYDNLFGVFLGLLFLNQEKSAIYALTQSNNQS